MSLPNSSAQNADLATRSDDCRRAGAAVLNLLKRGIRPRDIMTRKAFENAITVVIALGGSTNAVLHLLAMAHAAGVKLTHRRLHAHRQTRARCSPTSSRAANTSWPTSSTIGGILPLMKMLLDAGLLARRLPDRHRQDAARRTSRGREALSGGPGRSSAASTNPIKKDSHLVILYGNLAPEGAVAKISGKEGLTLHRQGPRVRGRGSNALTAILDGTVQEGRRDRHPLRRAEGRPRHARDAVADQRRSWARASARTSR